MSNQLRLSQFQISNLAEGIQESEESVEPDSPLKTTMSPVVQGQRTVERPAAETGLISQVNIEAEGRDDDDAQDASLTTEETKPAPKSEGHPMSFSISNPTVLIIEDTTELAEVIQATLERMNIHAVYETRGAKGLEKLDEMKPDVLLLDISLPDMTGWKILDTIKERQEQGKMEKMPAIIVITAYGDPANRLVGKLQGVYSYLVKPFTPTEVEKIVGLALGQAPQ
jgi:CheY-like chemotaxis protein